MAGEENVPRTPLLHFRVPAAVSAYIPDEVFAKYSMPSAPMAAEEVMPPEPPVT